MTDETHPSDDRAKALQQRLGLGWQHFGRDEEPRPAIPINRSEVPEQFHHLIPYAEEFHLHRDVASGDSTANPPRADDDHFYQAVLPHWEALHIWLCEAPRTDAKRGFNQMLNGTSEALPPPPTELIAGIIFRRRAEQCEARHKYWREIARKSKH
ncbi:MAG: hypothetical protein ABIP85_18945 [Chthoniobacteraceae bacterium]